MFDGRNILITGGSGSLGRALTHRILDHHSPRKIIIFSRGESKQDHMKALYPEGGVMKYIIGDIRDRSRVMYAMRGVDVVIHAAAVKTVPAAEQNPCEAIQTNIGGTKNVLEAALGEDVEALVNISTDKAVMPLNVYGSTKKISEALVTQMSTDTNSRFCSVRYGNVMMSTGAVVPLFLQQAPFGEITITNPEMTRYLMSFDTAIKIIKTALKESNGGEIFVPHIQAASLLTIAQAVAPDARRTLIGTRPGEKLHEDLISSYEAGRTKPVRDHYVIYPTHQRGRPSLQCGYNSYLAEHLSPEEIRAMMNAELARND